MGGATLDEPVKEGAGLKINGSALIAVGDSKEEVMKNIVESDVYYKSGVWDAEKVGLASAGSQKAKAHWCRRSRSFHSSAPYVRNYHNSLTLLASIHCVHCAESMHVLAIDIGSLGTFTVPMEAPKAT